LNVDALKLNKGQMVLSDASGSTIKDMVTQYPFIPPNIFEELTAELATAKSHNVLFSEEMRLCKIEVIKERKQKKEQRYKDDEELLAALERDVKD
jgi:L-cystine uptake protein TcyP (sodium:dicarboxylate symporter family)